MDYSKILSTLDELLIFIDENNPSKIELFSKYLEEIKDIPAFSWSNVWDEIWRSKTYDLWEKFSMIKGHDASEFLDTLNKLWWENNEPLSFTYSEILWNYFISDSEFIEDTLKNFIKNFPWNPEFYHTYWHYLSNKGNSNKAIINYQKAIFLDKKNRKFINRLFNEWHTCISNLIKEDKYIEAKKVLEEFSNYFSQEFCYSDTYNNMIYSLKERIEDHIMIQEKILWINAIIEEKVSWIRSNLINLVSVFTAIIWYLLTWITFSLQKNNINDSFLLLTWTWLVVILFVIIVSYQFKPLKEEKLLAFLKHKEFWIIIAILVTLLIMYKII